MQCVPAFIYISNERYLIVVSTANPSVYQQVGAKNSFVLTSFRTDSWPWSRVYSLTFLVIFLSRCLKFRDLP